MPSNRGKRHTDQVEWLLNNIGAAAVGVIVGGTVAFGIATLRRRRFDRMRTQHLTRDAGPNQARVHRFFRAVGQVSEVYRPAHFDLDQDLPILVHSALIFDVDVRQSTAMLVLRTPLIERLPVDERVIERRREAGTELWNGDLIYAVGSDLSQSPPIIWLKRSTYFAYVTAVDRVVTALWARRPGRSQVLADYRSVAAALGSTQPRLWLSGAAVMLIDGEDSSPRVVIHRRSSRVVNAPGMRTVAPVFGCDAAMIGDNLSALGIALYNIAREYGEELFDKESIVQANLDNWFHPDQIVDAVEEIRVFLDDFESGSVQVSVLGMCVNPKDCDLSLAFLVEIKRASKSWELLRRMRAGWEAEPGDLGDSAVAFLDLFDPRLDEWAAGGQLYPTSVFALDRARTIIRSRATPT
jgi:hypothetical protein